MPKTENLLRIRAFVSGLVRIVFRVALSVPGIGAPGTDHFFFSSPVSDRFIVRLVHDVDLISVIVSAMYLLSRPPHLYPRTRVSYLVFTIDVRRFPLS